MLTASKYEEELEELLSSSKPLDTSNVADCLSGTGLGFYIPDVTGSVSSACTLCNLAHPLGHVLIEEVEDFA